jgi:L-ascorbate 6-phosphate lactonase
MMITPVRSGLTLIDEINATQPQAGEVAIWWLGQSGYAFKSASALLYIDLYLSEHLTTKYANSSKPHIRMTEAPLRGEQIANAVWVLASHKHSDHLDPGTLPALMRASPTARLILPAALVEHAVSLGLARERLVPTRGNETLRLSPQTVAVHSLPSAHPDFDDTPELGYPFLGFVLEMDGVRLYHSGDTLVYNGLVERLQAFDPDVLFLPINGTDAQRAALQVPPNMNHHEAVALAEAVKARLTIPHHYDMFTFNTVDVGEFERAAQAAGILYRVLRCGERFVYSTRQAAHIPV